MPGSASHLVARFFDALAARPLTRSEREEVEDRLDPELVGIFFAQPVMDQRHGLHAARLAEGEGGSPAAVRAALLHDVGKRHARLGVIGRSLASVMMRLHLPLPRRARLYRDHGELAAAELERLGAEPLAVDFARYHHGTRPDTIDEPTWLLLSRADAPAKTMWRLRPRIT